MKFRKKPVVVEAVQFTREWAESCLLDGVDGPFGLPALGSWNAQTRIVHNVYLSIRTLEGTMTASVGDWIINGVKGELYPCKPDVFAETYEVAT